ncbi:MAG: hypothetical protein COB53_12990 [Elusimicrobia bacterium]|nr:MAG: hypothetical protein COB53_12990 [Elusimicrobiota bacterium]
MATLQQIVAYIKLHSAKYPVASLKAQLLKQGVPAATIDQAIAALQGKPAAGAPPAQARPAANPAQPGVRPAQQPGVRPAQQPGVKPAQQPGVRPAQQPGVRPAQPGVPAARPAASPAAHPASAPSAAAPKKGAFKPPPGRNFILVVDDDPLIRDMLVAKLEGAGYRVTCAEDAAQSVIQAEGMRLSLIISDIEMPGFGTGVDALKKLRASSYIPKNLPVIFVTGMPPAEAQKIVPKNDPYIRLLHKPVDWALMAKYMLDLSGLDKPLD